MMQLMLKLLNQEHYRKQATVDDIQAIFNVALAEYVQSICCVITSGICTDWDAGMP
jgi:hypothetical protein